MSNNQFEPTSQYQALYLATIESAAAGGSVLMGKLVAATGTALYAREKATRDLRERDALAESAKLLQAKEGELRAQYPKALLAAFSNPEQTKKAVQLSMATLTIDQLELMDELQVQESVTMARAQQVAMLAAEASLAELNTLICSTLGLTTVRPERNPLRPEIYVNALKEVVEQLHVPTGTRLDWLGAMSVALGRELHELYLTLAARLRDDGVVAAGYAVMQTPGGGGGGGGRVAPDLAPAAQTSSPEPSGEPVPGAQAADPASKRKPPHRRRGDDDALLTLDKLRRLLAGELGQHEAESRPAETFSQRFSREFESTPAPVDSQLSDFPATVPAAFEALKEMKQLDHVVQRLEKRKGKKLARSAADETPGMAVRDGLRRHAGNVAQALSLEVVSLMVDNMAQDPRLLEPVKLLIRNLEPALLRLALVDPRFFTDKQHPARALLQEVTNRSFAYGSVQTPGFDEFLHELQEGVAPLMSAPIENADPFERALRELRESWRRASLPKERARDEAVEALQHAEQRNELAEKIARDIEAHPSTSDIPAVVVDFLCGPWAQVVAQARITGGSSSLLANKYQTLVSALLWSAHPELSRSNTSKLTLLVPRLLNTLREGLQTIRYPATKTSAFFEALLGLHQLAFRAGRESSEAAANQPPMSSVNLRPHRVEQGDPWVAPEEARTSNLIELDDAAQTAGAQSVQDATEKVAGPVAEAALGELPMGSWVDLLADGQWTRTQLTWSSPHGTLFLFTRVDGATQSMTRRSRDKLVAAGALRVISAQPVVEGALDAVAQIAMRNSIDVTF